MITFRSPHLRPSPPALPILIVEYVGRTPVRLPSRGVSNRLLEESAASIPIAIAMELGRSRHRKFIIYDVFLSFKGRDVRRGFVDHLYNALTRGGLHEFLDTHQINGEEDISASLQNAVEVSRILIAQSAWCLSEASLIAQQVLLQGKEESAIAIPLFHNVTPELKKLVIGRIVSSNIAVYLGGHSKKTRIGD